eukprot:1921437-Amphidinium_carterae.1
MGILTRFSTKPKRKLGVVSPPKVQQYSSQILDTSKPNLFEYHIIQRTSFFALCYSGFAQRRDRRPQLAERETQCPNNYNLRFPLRMHMPPSFVQTAT